MATGLAGTLGAGFGFTAAYGFAATFGAGAGAGGFATLVWAEVAPFSLIWMWTSLPRAPVRPKVYASDS